MEHPRHGPHRPGPDGATSLTFFDEALRLDPAFAKALYNRANAFQPLGEPERALADLDAALTGAETPLRDTP